MAVSTRQALLQALSSAGGSYVSGQQLAETLGVSRAAVHKAAAALTAQGYALEAAPRRGYRLAGGDPFCAEAIGDYPAPIYLYDTLESSNRTAKLLALDGAPHGTLVLTAHQSAGRGRLGRRFESPAGKGVYCSVLLLRRRLGRQLGRLWLQQQLWLRLQQQLRLLNRHTIARQDSGRGSFAPPPSGCQKPSWRRAWQS